jgi:hypothetical protein
VISTEREIALDFLRASISSNLDPDLHNLTVSTLDWTHQPEDHAHLGNFEVILGADIIYIEETFPDLLRTLLHFAHEDTTVLLSCKIRYKRESKFLTLMEEHFHIRKVHFDSPRDIYIYSANRIR